jgi:hypothetical protein
MRLTVKNKAIAGPDGSDRFQGHELTSSFLIIEKSWPFIERLFKACQVGLPGVILDPDTLLTYAQKLTGLRYDATVRRVGDDKQFVAVTNERPTPARSPYR